MSNCITHFYVDIITYTCHSISDLWTLIETDDSTALKLRVYHGYYDNHIHYNEVIRAYLVSNYWQLVSLFTILVRIATNISVSHHWSFLREYHRISGLVEANVQRALNTGQFEVCHHTREPEFTNTPPPKEKSPDMLQTDITMWKVDNLLKHLNLGKHSDLTASA